MINQIIPICTPRNPLGGIFGLPGKRFVRGYEKNRFPLYLQGSAASSDFGWTGGRWEIRTLDPYRVKVML